MYLSKSKIIFSNIISSVLLLVSIPFVFLGIVGFLMDFFKFLGENDMEVKRELRQSLGIAVGILMFFGTILIISLKRFIKEYQNQVYLSNQKMMMKLELS